jgi:hypothetical protein
MNLMESCENDIKKSRIEVAGFLKGMTAKGMMAPTYTYTHLSHPPHTPPSRPHIPARVVPPQDTDKEIVIAALEYIKKFLHFSVFYILPVAVQDGFEDLIVPIQAKWSTIDDAIESS